ncbi:hypothetical protein GUITHDRAFT_148818 [Guillardia theta CCMP2712]|uniref:Armadillo repeat-containing domain-containing protein n=1 Tax=Guillardia theta (strain CCMP2712) TaxID=905079 RepID=L1I8C3_GUITC|nr:hypothetical protein GUITHDRAFT_148818 [Guillardia theta CCMP2712]EKX32149.1 hypothetical protein GUITHDRAFT_148818 [Guillardia theta CCMP2712]|eukprot:XP_005819129.1 hypothetical protein GUITHDRAFT_148818 [Guillardia theta CCMP2712]
MLGEHDEMLREDNVEEELKGNEEEAWVAGAIEAMISAMKRGSVNEKLARAGSLINLSRGNSDNNSLIFEAEGVPAIVDAMCAHRNNLVIQKLACQALNSKFANIFLIAKADGVSAIIAAMRALYAHPDSCAIQELACKALKDLTANEEIVGLILGAGGIPAIVAAMRTHLDRLEVQKKGCLVILSLIEMEYEFYGEIISRILEQGAIPVLVAAMRAHHNCPAMQSLACNIFSKLNQENQMNEDGKVQIRETGGIAAIVAAIRAHPDDREMHDIGWMALMSLHRRASYDDETFQPWEWLEPWDQSGGNQLAIVLGLETRARLTGYRRKPKLYG